MARVVAYVAALSCSGLVACSSSGSAGHGHGVDVTVVNSNQSDVMIYGCPVCKPTRLEGCRKPACPEPEPGQDLSGGFFGWLETRTLPRTYRMVLLRTGQPLNCPPATGPPPTIPTSTPYAVVYDITPSGRCIIAGHVPLN